MAPAELSRRAFLATTTLALPALCGRRAFAVPSGATTVRTRLGTLRGETFPGGTVFRGVPFAAPPVGEARFLPPQPVQHWAGERDATHFAPAALQTGALQVPHSEDCLYLNLWVPEGKGPFPVYVWIHGGGFTGGYSFDPTFDGQKMAREGIICITVAYRLGVFGFLDLEPILGAKYAGSANNGLRDLMAALEWVKANAADFHGDPSRVTLGGESAGAKLSDLLMGVPAAHPLFQQVISESGGAERIWPRPVAEDVADGFLKQWKTGAGHDASMLLTAPGVSLIETQQSFIESWPQHFPLRAMLDGTLIGKLPIQTIAAGSTHGKRLLIGTNREESAAFVGPHPGHDATGADLGNMDAARFAQVYAEYARVYPEMSVEARRIQALTAEEYWVPSVRVANAHVKGGGTAWMYRLDFAERKGRLKGYAYHSLDTGMVWDKPHTGVGNDAEEAALGRQMHNAWAAFIKGRTPAADGLPPWPEYQAGSRPTMILNKESHVEQQPQEAELRLWNGLL